MHILLEISLKRWLKNHPPQNQHKGSPNIAQTTRPELGGVGVLYLHPKEKMIHDRFEYY
jgi:hypothetical protein